MNPTPSLLHALRRDFHRVFRQTLCRENLLQLTLDQLLPTFVVLPPRRERLGDAGCHLMVDLVQFDDRVSEELVTGSVLRVEVYSTAGETQQQGVVAVGVGHVECRVIEHFPHREHVPRHIRHSLHKESRLDLRLQAMRLQQTPFTPFSNTDVD